MTTLSKAEALALKKLAQDCLCEDLGIQNGDFRKSHGVADFASADPSCAAIDANARVQATILTRDSSIMCGALWADEVLRLLDAQAKMHWCFAEGEQAPAGATLCEISADARALVIAERTMLNLLQVFMATATAAHRLAQRLKDHKITLLDTRKTLPAMRLAQKYAVRVGGMTNHRLGLFDAVMLKDSHIDIAGSVTAAVEKARSQNSAGDLPIIVEVRDFAELEEAVSANIDIVMLDNFARQDWKKAHALVAGRGPYRSLRQSHRRRYRVRLRVRH